MRKLTKKKLSVVCFLAFLMLFKSTNDSSTMLNYLKQEEKVALSFNRLIVMNSIKLVKKQQKKKRGPIRNQTRSTNWWDVVVLGEKLNDQEWKENFRMGKDTFKIICNKLRSALEAKPNKLNIYWKKRQPLNAEKKVAIGLYFLASCCEYRIVANQFGVHKNTVCKVVHEFVTAVTKYLTPEYIKFPGEAEALEYAGIFCARSNIPNIIGAIDGTHIPILPPTEGYRDYINRKGWPSMILQAVVGPYFQFMDISIKQPGRSHDMAAFINSSLFRNIERVMPKGSVNVNGQEYPYVIVGDPAYPLLPWLLKGFTGQNLTEIEDSFNAYMNSARVAVEIVFGRLKARWRCLLKRLDVHHSFVPHVVAACCTLHNVVEHYKEEFCPIWMKEVENAEIILQQPGQQVNITTDEYAGYEMRVSLSQYLANNYPLRTSKKT